MADHKIESSQKWNLHFNLSLEHRAGINWDENPPTSFSCSSRQGKPSTVPRQMPKLNFTFLLQHFNCFPSCLFMLFLLNWLASFHYNNFLLHKCSAMFHLSIIHLLSFFFFCWTFEWPENRKKKCSELLSGLPACSEWTFWVTFHVPFCKLYTHTLFKTLICYFRLASECI